MSDSKYWYMKVTHDKYSLPEAVAESSAELAKMLGERPQYVRQLISIGKNFKHPGYIRIEKGEDDDFD